MTNILRDARSPADVMVLGTILLLIVGVPVLNLLVPETSPLHLSTFSVTLLGKYMCYAVLALSVDGLGDQQGAPPPSGEG